MKGGWVYTVANRVFGTLYVDVTNDIERRAWEHRRRVGSNFTSKYRVGRLVYPDSPKTRKTLLPNDPSGILPC